MPLLERCQFHEKYSRDACFCSGLNICSWQLPGIDEYLLTIVLLILIKLHALPKRTSFSYLDLVRAEMKQFERFHKSIRLRFFREAAYTQFKLPG